MVDEAHPSQIGPYRIIKTLGEGAMARVYLAELVATGGFRRKCALKVVHPEFARDSKFIELMQREARLGALLEHPNIVNTISHGDFKGVHFIDLEYVEGKTLDEFLDMMLKKGKRGLELSFCLQIILPILRGLDYAHNFTDESWEGPPGMVHRDLKPANIMLSNQAVVKIMDFGIAKAKVSRTKLTNIGQVRGTPVYMAPEQVTGKEVDGRSDQFSAASVFYELVTGKRLFSGVNLIHVMQSVAHAKTSEAEQLMENACPGLGSVLARMWEQLPEKRYKTCSDAADALADVLANYLEGPVVRKQRKAPSKGTRKRAKRNEKPKPAMFGLLSSLAGRSQKKTRKRPSPGTTSPGRRRRRKKKTSPTGELGDANPVLESAEDWSVASAMLHEEDAPVASSFQTRGTSEQGLDSGPIGESVPADPGSLESPEGGDIGEDELEADDGKTISMMFMNVIFDESEQDTTPGLDDITRDQEDATTVRDEAVLSQNTLSPLTPIKSAAESEQPPEPEDRPDQVTESLKANMQSAVLEPADEPAEVDFQLDETVDLLIPDSRENRPSESGISETLDLNPLARPHQEIGEPPTPAPPHREGAKADSSVGDSSDISDDGSEGGDLDDFFSGSGDEQGDSDGQSDGDIDDFFSDSFDQ